MKTVRRLCVLLAILATACQPRSEPQSAPEGTGTPSQTSASEALSVFTVNYPLQYLAERIGGDLVVVTFPVQADVDPAYWAPGAEDIRAYQEADLILLNGLGYARWLQRATLPSSKLVDTSLGYEDRRIPLTEGTVHSHGPEGEHSHKGYAFTSWLDPRLMIEQAQAIADALGQAMPAHQASFEENLASLTADLEDLSTGLEAAAKAVGEQPILFSHPVYQYLEAGYGLNGRSVHWEPDQPPSEEQWRELAALYEEHPALWMVWEGEPGAETAGRLADLGVQSVVYDPCANRPESGDLLSIMRQNVAALASIGSGE